MLLVCVICILLLTVYAPSMSESSELLSDRWLLRTASLYRVCTWYMFGAVMALMEYRVYDAPPLYREATSKPAVCMTCMRSGIWPDHLHAWQLHKDTVARTDRKQACNQASKILPTD